MKQEVSDFYKQQGYDTVYIGVNKEPRRVATLRDRVTKKTHTMSYAKYLYTSHHKVSVSKYDHIDHINGDRMDDRIENLQVISAYLNIAKDHRRKTMIEVECPVCKCKFLFDKRNLSTHPNPCCSRRCGGIKSHLKCLP